MGRLKVTIQDDPLAEAMFCLRAKGESPPPSMSVHVSIERWVAATTLRLGQFRPRDLSELGSILHSESNGMAKQKASTRNGAGWMGGGYPFRTLPDHLRPGLDLVFVGINPGLYSVQRGHYFARTTSRFWPAFSRSKLSERMRRELKLEQLLPEHDSQLPRFGIGLTDAVKRPSANASQLTPEDFATWTPVLLTKLRRYKPRVACFHGLTAYRPFHAFAFKSAGAPPTLGEQPETIGATRL